MPYIAPDQQKKTMKKIMQDYRKRKKDEKQKTKIFLDKMFKFLNEKNLMNEFAVWYIDEEPKHS